MDDSFNPEDVQEINIKAMADDKNVPCNIWGFIRDLQKTVLAMQMEINTLKSKVT